MGISKETREKWDDYIRFVINNQDKLNDWELEFIESVSSFRDKGNDLSFKQSKCLSKIVHKLEE